VSEAGESRPTLVLVHGWGMGPACWGGYAQALSADFDVRCPALPGHGGTPPSPGWTPEALADEWAANWPGAFWIGWSLGALVALAAAIRSPRLLRGLLLIGATPRFLAGDDWPCAMAPKAFETFRDGCRDDPIDTLARFLALQVRGSEAARATLRSLRQLASGEPAPGPTALLDGLGVLAETDLRKDLAGVRCPTLWVTGEADALTPPGAARRAAGNQPQARVSCVPGAGHAPFISHQPPLLNMTRNWFLDKPT
jgi:pimeloyl-[acyl-carrier protein] methyl ester esterase